jgi:hypothetical protein
MRRSNKDRKSRRDQSQHRDDDASGGSSRSSSASRLSAQGKGPSLDKDIEGRPGHLVTVNKEGVESR